MAARELQIATNAEALMDRHSFSDIMLIDGLPPEWQVLGLLLAYCVLMAVSTLHVFEKRDRTPGR